MNKVMKITANEIFYENPEQETEELKKVTKKIQEQLNNLENFVNP
jgi:hypothetical protein